MIFKLFSMFPFNTQPSNVLHMAEWPLHSYANRLRLLSEVKSTHLAKWRFSSATEPERKGLKCYVIRHVLQTHQTDRHESTQTCNLISYNRRKNWHCREIPPQIQFHWKNTTKENHRSYRCHCFAAETAHKIINLAK